MDAPTGGCSVPSMSWTRQLRVQDDQVAPAFLIGEAQARLLHQGVSRVAPAEKAGPVGTPHKVKDMAP